MRIHIRPWQPEDTDTVVEWYRKDPKTIAGAGFPEDADEFDVRRALVFSQASRFMAFRDEIPVAAFAVYDVRQDGTGFVSVVTDPSQSGFATVAAAKQMRQALFNGIGMRDLRAVVSEENEAALKLARLIGFDDLGVRTLRLVKEDDDGPGNSTSDR